MPSTPSTRRLTYHNTGHRNKLGKGCTLQLDTDDRMIIMAQTIQTSDMTSCGTRRRSTRCKPLCITDDVISVWMPLPDLAEDELLVRIKACGICGSDLHMYRLGMFEALGRQAAAGLRSLLAGNMQSR